MISRGAMLRGLMNVSFHGRSSEYLWEMDNGEVHRIPQGEGGEQGDPMMPLLYSLGQHGALEAVNDRLTRGERLLAFLDDTFIVAPIAAEAGPAYGHVREALMNHCGIHIHVGKTKTWNRAGNRPAICDMLERIAQRVNPRAKVWRGSQVPTADQGMKVLGTPLGHEDYVARHLESVAGATCPVGAHTQGPRRPERMVACCIALQHVQTTSSAQCLRRHGLFCCDPRCRFVEMFVLHSAT